MLRKATPHKSDRTLALCNFIQSDFISALAPFDLLFIIKPYHAVNLSNLQFATQYPSSAKEPTSSPFENLSQYEKAKHTMQSIYH
jgi:hypothetical protein